MNDTQGASGGVPGRPSDDRAAGPRSGIGIRLRLIALVACLGVLVAACSSGAGPSGNATPADTEKALLAFAQCVRGQGVDIPDPTVDSEGNARIRGPEDPAQHDAFEEAQKACDKYLQGVTQGFRHSDPTKEIDQLLQLAQCLRARGIDVPDPDFGVSPGQGHESGGGGDPFGGALDLSDPRVQKALPECQQQVYGPGGGPFHTGDGH